MRIRVPDSYHPDLDPEGLANALAVKTRCSVICEDANSRIYELKIPEYVNRKTVLENIAVKGFEIMNQ